MVEICVVKFEHIVLGEEQEFAIVRVLEVELDAGIVEREFALYIQFKPFILITVNGDMSDLLLVFDKESAQRDTNLGLILRYAHIEDLDVLLAAILDLPRLPQLERFLIIDTNGGSLCEHIRSDVA